MYKYEMHLHSCTCSACGVSTAEEMVTAAKNAGYSGIIFTNHFYHGNTAVDRHLPWNEFMDVYKLDYLKAKKFAANLDIDVLFGLEEVYEPGKEVLIYGIEPDTFIGEPKFLHMSMAEMYEFVHKNGGFCACAHPFRERDYIPSPHTPPDMRYFDAVEAYNFCNPVEQNEAAFEFARQNGLRVLSGGDVHRTTGFGFAGLAFYERIRDNKALVTALTQEKYKLIIDGEIQ